MDKTPCTICGQPGFSGTGLCDPCWEVKHRIPHFLNIGKTEAMWFLLKEILTYREQQNFREDPVYHSLNYVIHCLSYERKLP